MKTKTKKALMALALLGALGTGKVVYPKLKRKVKKAYQKVYQKSPWGVEQELKKAIDGETKLEAQKIVDNPIQYYRVNEKKLENVIDHIKISQIQNAALKEKLRELQDNTVAMAERYTKKKQVPQSKDVFDNRGPNTDLASNESDEEADEEVDEETDEEDDEEAQEKGDWFDQNVVTFHEFL